MLNKIIIIGRLTKDIELKYTNTQIPVASFAIASERDFAKNADQKETDFFNVVAWRSTAEFVSKWFQKGSLIIVDGKLQTRKWKDKYDQNRTEVEIIAENVYFGESKQRRENTEYGNNQIDYTMGNNDFKPLDDDEDVPF